MSIVKRRCGFDRVYHHLAPGGLFAFDIVFPDLSALTEAQTACAWLELDQSAMSGLLVEEIASYDPVQQVRVSQ
jgi:hypothetical protein